VLPPAAKEKIMSEIEKLLPVGQPRLVSGSPERMAMEILRTDMRITDARLSDAIDHEEGLRSLHDAATDRVALLRSIKRDLQARVDSISSANSQAQEGKSLS